MYMYIFQTAVNSLIAHTTGTADFQQAYYVLATDMVKRWSQDKPGWQLSPACYTVVRPAGTLSTGHTASDPLLL